MRSTPRESEIPHRPTVLRRGSVGPQPLATTYNRSAKRQLASLNFSSAARLIRTLVVLAILGTVGWRVLSGAMPTDLEAFKRAAWRFYEDLVTEINGGPVRQTVESVTSVQPQSSVSEPVGAWRQHLNKAIKLADKGSRDDQAEAEYMNALFVAEDFAEPDERLTSVLDHFGYFYDQRGRHDDAMPHYLRALEGYRVSVGENHEHFISLARRIGYAYRAQSAHQQALSYLGVAVDAATALHGEDYSGVAYGYREIADIRLSLGDESGALQAYLRALDVSIRSLGPGHKLTSDLQREINKID